MLVDKASLIQNLNTTIMKHRITVVVVLVLMLISCGNDPDPSFEQIWEYEYTKDAESLSLVNTNPTLLEDKLLIAPDHQLTLLDTKTGNIIWQFEIPDDPFISTEEFLISSSTLYQKDDQNHRVYAIDLGQGKQIWGNDVSPNEFFSHSNDGLDTNYLYLNGAHGHIYQFLKSSGSLTKVYNILDYGIRDRARSIRVLNNQLIFSQRWRFTEDCPDGYCGRVISIDKETEEVLWEYRTDKGGYIFEPILLEEGIIYAGVTDGPGEFVALDATNGEVIWQAPGVVSHAYTLTDSMVLVQGGITLRALDKFTGEELWNTGLKFGGGHGQQNIAYLNGYVYHIHSGSMWILEADTGEIVHREAAMSGYLVTAGEDKIFVQGDYSLRAYTAWK
jgi:outer membrane protein assembly factor BamB